MGAEPTVVCPSCHCEIKLTESLAAPLIEVTRKEYESKLARQRADSIAHEQALKKREEELAKEKEAVDATIDERLKKEREKLAADTAKHEAAIKEREASLIKEKEGIDAAVAERIKSERSQIAADESKRARQMIGDELERKARENADLTALLKARDEKLAEAQKAQVELIKKQRELDDAKREMELTIEKRISESLDTARQQARKEADAQHELKLIEKQTLIESMQKQVEELKKKAEQGSQQAQGEALELQLESLLAGTFPHDTITPVPKGEHGGDILQRVLTPGGVACGTILWESKRTRNWSGNWLPKLRDDQRQAKAEIAVIVSAVLPAGVDSFNQIDGVWVVHPRCALPVAMSLRQMLIEVSAARQASEGQQTKMELIYQYLIGNTFRLRVQAIVEAFTNMGEDLAREKKAIQKQWAKREQQICVVMEATVGMYGELQGIAGKSLKEIEGLSLDGDGELPALPA